MKASILVPTYNHGKYISQCLDSLVEQISDSDFEILVGEDDSTDNTRNICEEYAKNYPGLIRLFLNNRSNVIYFNGKPSGRWNLMNLLHHAKGEYIAICEGDDYWIDREKLKKQINYLDERQNLSFCFHPVNWLNESTNQISIYQPTYIQNAYSIDDLLINKNFIAICSVLYRSSILKDIEDWFKFIPYGDLTLHLFSASKGQFGYIPKVMSTYRRHEKGFYSAESPVRRTIMAIQTLHLINQAIGLDRFSGYKKGLSNFYLQLAKEAVDEARMINTSENNSQKPGNLKTSSNTVGEEIIDLNVSQSITHKNNQEDVINTKAIELFSQSLDYFKNQNFSEADKLMDIYRRQIDYSKFSILDNRPNNSPFVSVVVVAYNTNEMLLECISSLLQQSYKNFEVLIIDNGRNEQIYEKLSRLPILYIKCPINLFLSEGRNIGVFFARGEIVSFLDDDAYVPANYIETTHQCFKEYNIVGFRGKVLPKTPSPNSSADHYDLGDTPFLSTIDTEGNSAFTRDAYIRVGGMNPLLFGMEGLEISYKLMKIYGPACTIYWPSTIIYHDYAATNTKLKTKLKRYSLMRNYLTKEYPDIYVYHNDLRARLSIEHKLKDSNNIIPRQNNASISKNLVADYTHNNKSHLNPSFVSFSASKPKSHKPNPFISIVIPTHNRADFLSQSIESALSQEDVYSHFEVLVVDDGSTDHTDKIVKSFGSSKLRYIKKEHNGAPKTRNYSIQKARGDYILWLDDDDILKPSVLRSYIDILLADPEIDVVYGNLEFFNSDTGKITDLYKPNDWSNKHKELRYALISACPIPNPATLIKKSVYFKVGFYDETFKRAHDYEFWTRAATVLKFKKNESTVCRYRIHSNNMSIGKFIDQSYESLIIRKMAKSSDLKTIFYWLDWEKEAAATSVAKYLIAQSLFRFGDCYNCKKILNQIPRSLWSTEVFDLAFNCSLSNEDQLWNDSIDFQQYEFHPSRDIYNKLSTRLTNSIKSNDTDLCKSIIAEFGRNNFSPTPELLARVAKFLYHTGDIEMSIHLIKNLFLIDPTYEGRNNKIIVNYCSTDQEELTSTLNRVLNPIRDKEWLGVGENKTIDNDKSSYRDFIQDAKYFYEREEYSKSTNSLALLLNKHPKHWTAYELLMDVLLQSGQVEHILKTFKSLEFLSDIPANILALIGSGYEATNDTAKAKIFADQSLDKDLNCAQGWNLKGIIECRNTNPDAAVRYFQKASDCDSTWGDPWTNLGMVYWEQDEFDTALEYFEKGFILSPTAPNIATTYHIAISESLSHERARPVFENAVERYPDFRKARFFLIDILTRLKDYEGALTHIEEAIVRFDVDPQFLEVSKTIREKVGPFATTANKHSSISLCMIVKNEVRYLARCLKSLKPIVHEMIVVDTGSSDATPDIAEVFGAKVFNFKWDDDFSAARNFSLEQASGDWILVMDADEVIAAKDHKNIRKRLNKAKSNRQAFMVITRNYTDQYNIIGWEPNVGQYSNEEEGTGWIPSEKVRLFRNDEDIRFEYPVHEVVGPALTRKGIPVKSFPYPVHHYGKMDRNDNRQKDEHYYKIGMDKLSVSPDDPVAIREMAVQAAKLDKNEDSIFLWKRFLAIQPDDPRSYINIASCHGKLKQYQKARDAAQKATLLAPGIKEAHLNLGLSELHLGNPSKAEKIFQRLVQNNHNYHAAVFLLGAAQFCNSDLDNGGKTLTRLRGLAIWDNLSYSAQELVESLIAADWPELALNLINGVTELNCSNETIKAYGRRLSLKPADQNDDLAASGIMVSNTPRIDEVTSNTW